MDIKEYRHIFLSPSSRTEPYKSKPRFVRTTAPPARVRAEHGEKLKKQFDAAWSLASKRKSNAVAVGRPASNGSYIEFISDDETTLALKSLDSSGMELRNVRTRGQQQLATVFIPDGKKAKFIKLLEQYLFKNTKNDKPKNENLMNRIGSIKLATVESLWTESPELFPTDEKEIWWEVWLKLESGLEEARFRNFATSMNIALRTTVQRFPERVVLLAKCSLVQLGFALESLDEIAELRKAKDTPSFFMELDYAETNSWIADLQIRSKPAPTGAPSICILDTGVNSGHPLLAHSIQQTDLHAYDPSWGTHDHRGHGTEMAGIALYGDLTEVFASREEIELSHCIESVKIVPPTGQNDPDLYGAITAECAARVELNQPFRNRTFSLATTATDTRDRGKPSAWSAAIDALAAGVDTSDGTKRLFVVSAGNSESDNAQSYLDAAVLESVHDPGQAWNSLTIGAYTDKSVIDEPQYAGWNVIATPGELGPRSTTSCIWNRTWPIKPELVLEGGNVAVSPDETLADRIDSLSLLTTYYQPLTRMLETTGDTSAATSLAARYAAIIQSEYPDYWPETVRGLLVHSGRWTEPMSTRFNAANTRTEKESLLRTYGYGVPNLRRALRSASNHLTLVKQTHIFPYEGEKMREMHLHELPWPVKDLQKLGEIDVTMRVTLSYFIEPNPGERGWKYRHRYASHGLRFDVKTPEETVEDFHRRLNQQAWQEEDDEDDDDTQGYANVQATQSDAKEWFFGPDIRSKGSYIQIFGKGRQ